MKTKIALAAVLALAVSTPALGQRTISAGMTEAQVRTAFGAPATTRAAGEWTYWYYHNGCPTRCGSDDVVFFREERVVAAVLRTSARRFSGPRANDALEPYDNVDARGGVTVDAPVNLGRIGNPRSEDEEADEGEARRDGEGPARVGGVRVNTPERQREGGTTTIIRGEAEREGAVIRRAGDDRLQAEAADTARGGATQIDDERREREGRVEPNTVRNQTPPNANDPERRERERRVQPRVVPRPE